jgi:hypothetical protein
VLRPVGRGFTWDFREKKLAIMVATPTRWSTQAEQLSPHAALSYLLVGRIISPCRLQFVLRASTRHPVNVNYICRGYLRSCASSARVIASSFVALASSSATSRKPTQPSSHQQEPFEPFEDAWTFVIDPKCKSVDNRCGSPTIVVTV